MSEVNIDALYRKAEKLGLKKMDQRYVLRTCLTEDEAAIDEPLENSSSALFELLAHARINLRDPRILFSRSRDKDKIDVFLFEAAGAPTSKPKVTLYRPQWIKAYVNELLVSVDYPTEFKSREEWDSFRPPRFSPVLYAIDSRTSVRHEMGPMEAKEFEVGG